MCFGKYNFKPYPTKYYFCSVFLRGAQFNNRAEIIPNEPDTGNAGEGIIPIAIGGVSQTLLL